MRDAILTLNAGSSSIKFLLFAAGADKQALEPVLRGQMESIHTSPHFMARDPAGLVVAEQSWGEGVQLGHAGAVAHLADYLMRSVLRGRGRHRVVHGGISIAPVLMNTEKLANLENTYRAPRSATQRR
jgi:acetate kinase